MLAIGVYKAALKIGFKIPDDISVIGYDDDTIASLVSPQLTTLKYPKESIASLCSEILIEKLVNNYPSVKQFSLEPLLVERQSIRNLK
jgi:DNA-binding LacI/PurR family transcriptional regulator